MAEEEIGFKMTSGIQAVQAAFLPNHDVVFTFSDKAENIGMDRALDHLKDMMTEEGWTDAERVDEIRGVTGQNQADAFAKLLREIQDRQEEELQESEAADREKIRLPKHRAPQRQRGRRKKRNRRITGWAITCLSCSLVRWIMRFAFADIFRDLRSGRRACTKQMTGNMR